MHTYSAAFLVTFLALAGISHSAAAQTNNETVEKVFTKNMTCSAHDALSVFGEKATIHVTGWNNNYIQARIIFSATHPDKKIASRELAFMKYALSRERNTIELRNTFILPSSTDAIQSKLEVFMELMVTLRIQLLLKNKYGNTEIRQLYGKVSAAIEFSDLNISNIHGELVLQSSYSEVRGHDIAVSSFSCQDEKSRIFLDVSAGAYTFNSKHSDLDLTLKNILALKIESYRTDITIRPERFDKYHYKLVSKEGTIYVPEQYTHQLKKEGKQHFLLFNRTLSKPFIQIATTFNSITIK